MFFSENKKKLCLSQAFLSRAARPNSGANAGRVGWISAGVGPDVIWRGPRNYPDARVTAVAFSPPPDLLASPGLSPRHTLRRGDDAATPPPPPPPPLQPPPPRSPRSRPPARPSPSATVSAPPCPGSPLSRRPSPVGPARSVAAGRRGLPGSRVAGLRPPGSPLFVSFVSPRGVLTLDG